MNNIPLPRHNSKDAVFLCLLVKGHTLHIDNLPDLVGFQDAPQRAYRLRHLGIPIRSIKTTQKPKYTTPIAFYYMTNGDIREIGESRLNGFIERVGKSFTHIEDIKKGLQLAPQPLNPMLAGKLTRGATNE